MALHGGIWIVTGHAMIMRCRICIGPERTGICDTDSVDDPLLDMLSTPPPFPALEPSLRGPFLEVTGARVPLALQVGRTEKGELICTGLLVGWGDPPVHVSARMLRSLRLADLVGSLADLAATKEVMADAPVVPNQHRGRRVHDDAHYQHVVDLYRQALVEAPERPVQLLAKRLHVSRATAHRWLNEASTRLAL